MEVELFSLSLHYLIVHVLPDSQNRSDTSVEYYRRRGFEPEALVNFVANLVGFA